MKKFKFKLRFSYFLIFGLIGTILQVVSYFLWDLNSLSPSQITNTSHLDYFNKYVASSYSLIFSGCCFIVLAIGIFLSCNKKQLVAKISSGVLGLSQLVMIVSLIVFLIFTSLNRKTMFSVDNHNANVLFVLSSIKTATIFVSAIAMGVIGFAFIEPNKNRKIGKIASYVIIVVNALFVLSMMVVYFGAISTPSYALIERFYEMEQEIAIPYKSNCGSMNGFTYGNMLRSFMLIQEALNPYKSGDFTVIAVGAIFALITNIAYCILVVGNFFSLAGLIIESFDVDRDDVPMSL